MLTGKHLSKVGWVLGVRCQRPYHLDPFADLVDRLYQLDDDLQLPWSTRMRTPGDAWIYLPMDLAV
jgi:hypothetical protein